MISLKDGRLSFYAPIESLFTILTLICFAFIIYHQLFSSLFLNAEHLNRWPLASPRLSLPSFPNQVYPSHLQPSGWCASADFYTTFVLSTTAGLASAGLFLLALSILPTTNTTRRGRARVGKDKLRKRGAKDRRPPLPMFCTPMGRANDYLATDNLLRLGGPVLALLDHLPANRLHQEQQQVLVLPQPSSYQPRLFKIQEF